MTVLNDKLVKGVPILIVMDISNSDLEDANEALKREISKNADLLVNTQYLEFNQDYMLTELTFGVEWLCSQMTAL